jgi:hypothetical protein
VTWCSPKSRIWHVKIAVDERLKVWFDVLVIIEGKLFTAIVNLIIKTTEKLRKNFSEDFF